MKAEELRIGNFVGRKIQAIDGFDQADNTAIVKTYPYIIATKVLAVDQAVVRCEDIDRVLDGEGYGAIIINLSIIKGIPLTPEWLESLGFELVDEAWHVYRHRFGPYNGIVEIFQDVKSPHWDHDLTDSFYLKTGTVPPMDNGEYGNPLSGFNPIKYVHQLQNLYFALTGEELALKEEVK